MSTRHTELSVNSNVSTLTLAQYAYGSAFPTGTSTNKGAKIEYDDSDKLIITSRQASSAADDTITIDDGTTTFSTAVSMGGTSNNSFVIPSNMSAGTDGQILKINSSGESYWADAPSSSTINISANNTTDETVYLTFVDGATGEQGLETDTGLSYNPSTGVLTSTTFNGALTGNADTATALETARTIGGVSFDGTANIDLPGVNTTGNQNTTGSAATLTTARTIGGVSFDGSANIDLPGVNTIGNQNTTGSAATLTTTRTIAGKDFNGSQNVVINAADLADVTNAGSGAIITTTERNKLNGIEAGAEVNVQADWNETDNTSDAYILNKPTISTVTNINDLSDVSITSLATNEILAYNGTNWVNVSSFSGDVTGNVTGDVTGNADTATLATTVTVTDSSTDTAFPIVFHDESNGLLDDTGSLTYNPSSGTLSAAVLNTSGNATVGGNLTINGTTTTINSTTLTVDDINIELGTVATPTDTTANGGGITLKGATDKTIIWDSTNSNWTFSEHINAASGKEYKIDNTSVLNATTLGSTVVSSSLTSVGTISTGVWQGTAIAHTYIDTGIAQDKIVKVSAADVASGEFARFTATGLESLTATELKTALNITSGLWSERSNSGEIYYNTGNVGIGTDDPNTKLEINKAQANAVSSGTNAHLYLSNSTASTQHGRTSIFMGTSTADNPTYGISLSADRAEASGSEPTFSIRGHNSSSDNAGTSLLTIKNNGDIGIGNVSTPTARLHIIGDDDLSTGNTMDLFDLYGASLFHVQNDGKVGIGTDDPSATLEIKGANDLSSSDAMVIVNNSGNTIFHAQNNVSVGIGTNIPKSTLDVEGTFNVTGAADNYQSEQKQLIFSRYGRNSLGRHHYISSRTDNNSENNNWLKFNIDDGTTVNGASHTSAMVITGAGRVGIGESTPTATLHIKGTNDFSSGNTMDLVNDSGDALFHVQNDGKVGIGTDNPARKLTLETGNNYDGLILNNSTSKLLAKLARGNSDTSTYFALYDGSDTDSGGSGTNTVTISNNGDSFFNSGNVGIGNTSPSVKLEVTGDIKSSGTVTATNVVAVSDGSLKTNIQPLENSLSVIQKLKGVSYDWSDPNNTDHEIGLIAQDVEQVVPEVVRSLGNSTLKGIEYQKLTAILIEAVKELSGKLNELNNKVNN